MFRRIIVPLDGSNRARQGVPVAARIARAGGGSVVLLRVLEPPTYGTWPMQRMLIPPEDLRTERTMIAAGLARLAASEELQGVETVVEVLEGLPAQIILDRAEELQADLIVLCSHGRAGITRWALGSVAQKVARHCMIPVLILCEGAGVPTNVHPEGQRSVRVLVALDGSALAESALLPAAQLSAALSAPCSGELHLLHVLPLSRASEPGQEDAAAQAKQRGMHEAQKYLQMVEQQLCAHTWANPDVQVTSSVVVDLDSAETVIRIAEMGGGNGLHGRRERSDIIALATHGRSGPVRWVMGSVAERVLSATRLPLLIVRPPTSQEKRG